MKRLLTLVTLLFIAVTLTEAAAAKCKVNGTQYDCTHLNFTSKDIASIGDDATAIDLSNNNIVNLTESLFTKFKGLATLNLKYNKISLVDEAAFKDCKILSNLTLAANKITALKNDTFKDPPLTSLSINNNSFDVIPENTFKDLKSVLMLDLGFLNTDGKLQNTSNLALGGNFKEMSALTHLNLIGNGIQTVSNDSFQYVNDKLNELHLCDNDLTSIKSGTFDRFKNNLTFICLYGNKLTEVDNGTFHPLTALIEVNMDNNNFKTFPASACGPNVQTLSIQKFLGESLPDDAFSECASLTDISLASSSLKSIGKAFQNLKITTLDLSNNKHLQTMDKDAFKNATQLKTLNLQGMSMGESITLYELPDAVTAVQLTDLDVSLSRFVTFSKNDTDYFDTLTHLKAYNNSFNCACKNIDFMAWFLINAKSIPESEKAWYHCATCDECGKLPMEMSNYNMSQCSIAPKEQKKKVVTYAVGFAFLGLAVGIILTSVVVVVLVRKQKLCFRGSAPYSNLEET